MTEKQWRVYADDHIKDILPSGGWESDPAWIRRMYAKHKGADPRNTVAIEEREVTYSEPREVSVEEVG